MIDINDSHDNSLLESKEVKELLAMDFWKWVYVSRNVSCCYPNFLSMNRSFFNFLNNTGMDTNEIKDEILSYKPKCDPYEEASLQQVEQELSHYYTIKQNEGYNIHDITFISQENNNDPYTENDLSEIKDYLIETLEFFSRKVGYYVWELFPERIDMILELIIKDEWLINLPLPFPKDEDTALRISNFLSIFNVQTELKKLDTEFKDNNIIVPCINEDMYSYFLKIFDYIDTVYKLSNQGYTLKGIDLIYSHKNKINYSKSIKNINNDIKNNKFIYNNIYNVFNNIFNGKIDITIDDIKFKKSMIKNFITDKFSLGSNIGRVLGLFMYDFMNAENIDNLSNALKKLSKKSIKMLDKLTTRYANKMFFDYEDATLRKWKNKTKECIEKAAVLSSK